MPATSEARKLSTLFVGLQSGSDLVMKHCGSVSNIAVERRSASRKQMWRESIWVRDS